MIISLTAILAACNSVDVELYRMDESDVAPTLVRTAPVSGAPRLVLEPLWESGPESWGDPSNVSIDASQVVVVDPLAARVHVLDATSGAEIHSFGRRGEGPGEWSRLEDAVLFGGRVAVSASGGPGIAVHAPSGEREASVAFDMYEPWIMGGPRDQVFATSPVLGSAAIVTPGSDSASVVEPPESTYDEAEYGSCAHLAPTDDGFARVQCSSGRIEFYDRAGLLLRRTQWPQGPREASDQELDAYIARYWAASGGGRDRNPIIDMQLARMAEVARITPLFSHFRSNRADGSFLLVEQPFRGFGGQPATLHRLDTDGRHLGVVDTDLFIRDLAMHGDRIALLVRDPETELVTLVVARIQSTVTPDA